jgi:hypothetical protein
MTFAYAIPTEGAPNPCVFCKGGQRCCMCYLIGYDATWISKLAPAFPTPALRKEREEPALSEVEGTGHPPFW